MAEIIRVDFRKEHFRRLRARVLETAYEELDERLDEPSPAEIDEAFDELYRSQYGFRPRHD